MTIEIHNDVILECKCVEYDQNHSFYLHVYRNNSFIHHCHLKSSLTSLSLSSILKHYSLYLYTWSNMQILQFTLQFLSILNGKNSIQANICTSSLRAQQTQYIDILFIKYTKICLHIMQDVLKRDPFYFTFSI